MRPFLVPARKGPKESGTGEALTAKPIRTTFINHHFSPASSRPPLCTPSGACRNSFCGRNSLSPTAAELTVLGSESSKTMIQAGPSTGAGWGSGGGRLKVGISVLDYPRRKERLCGQRIPQPLSLVPFLCGHKKGTSNPANDYLPLLYTSLVFYATKISALWFCKTQPGHRLDRNKEGWTWTKKHLRCPIA